MLGVQLKVLRFALGFSLASFAVAAASAADLPTRKAAQPAPPPKITCWSSFDAFLNTTPTDCPLSAGPFTVYGTIDVGGAYQQHGEPFNRYYSNGISALVAKFSNGGRLNWSPNNESQSNVGIKFNQAIFGDVSIVANAQLGFDPYSLQLANGPKSLYQNTSTHFANQSANGNSSRAGQWDNSFGYFGASSKTFGTLTFGRQTTFSNDLVGAYDPYGGAYAFSMIGSSGSFIQGPGATESARYNTGFKYLYNNNGIHAGGMVQVGGYAQGNGIQNGYQLQLGGEWNGFSVDGVFSQANGVVSLGTLTGSNLGAIKFPTPANGDLTGTISNNTAIALFAKYTWNQFKFSGGYEHVNLSDPSGSFGPNLTVLGDYTVAAPKTNAYVVNKALQLLWFGTRYAITPQWDVAGAIYYAWQNDYSNGAASKPIAGGLPAATCAITTTALGSCSGNEIALSGMVDWHPYKRFDMYAGLMYSKVSGGLSSGYTVLTGGNGYTSNIQPTAGLRISF